MKITTGMFVKRIGWIWPGIAVLIAGILSGCAPADPLPLPTLLPLAVVPTLTQTPGPTATATMTAVPPSTETPVVTPTPTATNTPSPTPDPYAGWTIAGMAARSYGGGQPQILETMAVYDTFTRYLVSFPSDGLDIYGFMNVPSGEGPFPVVLALHGYVNPVIYKTLDYTTGYADDLARAGYLVVHPNYRNYPPSDNGPNEFRAGYAIDILNLVALVKEEGGQPGPFELADPASISLWGHSMGGGIALRVITVSPDVKAAVLYGAMSGDEYLNFEQISVWTEGRTGLEELAIAEEEMVRISPIHHLDRIQAAVSIHHGSADSQVPPAWSTDLCQRLQSLGKQTDCFSYPGQPHTFVGEGDRLFRQRVLDFLGYYQTASQ